MMKSCLWSSSIPGTGEGDLFTNGNLRSLYKGKFMFCFLDKNGKGRELMAFSSILIPMSYFGVTYSDPFYWALLGY